MADEVLFAGGRLDSVVASGTASTENTSASFFDSAYADCAISSANGSIIRCPLYTVSGGSMVGATIALSETMWFHSEVQHSATALVNQNIWQFEDSSGFPWFALRVSATQNVVGLYYNSNTGASPTWTLIGSTFSSPTSTLRSYDFKITLGSPHTVEVYVANALQQTGTFTQASFTNITGVSHVPLSVFRISQMLATRNIPTVGAKIKTIRATGAGSNSAWSGTYTDVNEAVGSDSTVNTSATAGQKQTYAMGDITVPNGYVIKGVWQWLRAKNDGSTPLNVKSVMRVAGTDYVSNNLTPMGAGFNSVGFRYDVSPATGLIWTQSEWNSSEAGFQSET